MGDIPKTSNMISTIIISPTAGQTIPANTPFTVKVQNINLDAGTFTNSGRTYYSAPQQVSSTSNNIIGHVHVTIQDLGGTLVPQQPPNPERFAFFEAIKGKGDGKGLLEVTLGKGMFPGFYRACTITSAANHQPVVMPIAQRGAQDDCVRFTVTGDTNGAGAGNGASSNDPNGGEASVS